MFILLRHLQRMRNDIALPQPESRGSLALRHIDAGSCNACEHELTATAGPHYDLARYGISIAASPRHADVLLVTGAITTRMIGPLLAAHAAMPEPHLVAALGDCAVGCNVMGAATELAPPLREILPVHLEIPGCPPTPAQIAEHLIAALEARRTVG